MTNEHREQAREIVREWAEHDMDESYGSDYLRDEFGADHLEDRITDALSSRDAEIKEVLEGLIHAGVEFDDKRIRYVVMQVDRETLAAAKALYEKVSR